MGVSPGEFSLQGTFLLFGEKSSLSCKNKYVLTLTYTHTVPNINSKLSNDAMVTLSEYCYPAHITRGRDMVLSQVILLGSGSHAFTISHQGFIQDFIFGGEMYTSSTKATKARGSESMLPREHFRFRGSKHTLDAFSGSSLLYNELYFYCACANYTCTLRDQVHLISRKF